MLFPDHVPFFPWVFHDFFHGFSISCDLGPRRNHKQLLNSTPGAALQLHGARCRTLKKKSSNFRGFCLPSGKLTVHYGKSQFLMGKSTISMAIFNKYVKLPEGTTGWGPIVMFVGL